MLHELKQNGFKPRTMLDFGCGTGPGLWAANDLFNDHLAEYTGVDKSLDQLRMARFVVTGGHPDVDTPGIRFKKNLPEGFAYSREQYNIVLVSHTLGDIGRRKDRIKLLDQLWGKVHYEGGVLILIESGGVPGHELIQEARSHFIDNHRNGYAVAPCGHNAPCSLFRPPGGKEGTEMRNIVSELEYQPKCDFPVVYERPHWAYTYGRGNAQSRALVRERFNYVVIAKNTTKLPIPMQFPRVIAKCRTADRLHACVVCVNGKPVPVSAKRTREPHETALQLRRLGNLIKTVFLVWENFVS